MEPIDLQLFSPQDFSAQTPAKGLGYLILGVRRRMTDILEQELAPLDLTAAQFAVIMQLYRQEEETPAGFCRLLDYDPGAMTRLLYRIEHKGFIQRNRHPEDKRSVRFTLTPAGQALCPQILNKLSHTHNRLLKGFNREEVQLLQQFLTRMLANH